MGGKGKKLKTDRKKGVPFKMMFRHHKDPNYYDPTSNDKIFVPEIVTTVYFSLLSAIATDRGAEEDH